MDFTPVDYECASAINDVATLNISRLQSKPVEFVLQVSPDFPAYLHGDDLRMRQIFNNLLSNAFKYTEAGSVTWSINCETSGSTVWVVSSIADTGIGIREEDQALLFSDFTQVDLSAHRSIEGTGLGLSIVRQLVNLMGGTISLQSTYGKGSTFSVRIPQQAIPGTEPLDENTRNQLENRHYNTRKPSQTNYLERIQLPGKRVLVVDDVPTNLDVARGMLLLYGLDVDCVTSGAEALKLMQAERKSYSAIFMDHMMPRMDGVETAQAIRALPGSYAQNIPIIALTANAVVGVEQMFLANGFQAFISKPIDIMELDKIVHDWIATTPDTSEPH
jgi:CheY-like chemotaxis protein